MATRIFQPPESAPTSPSIWLVVEAETVQDLTGLRFERVAAKVLVFPCTSPKRAEDAVDVVGPRGIGHRHVQLFELVMQQTDAAAAGDGFVEHRSTGHLLDVLAEVADGQLLRHRDVAVVGRLFTDDHPEQRGLAGTIRPDETDLLAGVELERGVDEEDLPAVLLADPGE